MRGGGVHAFRTDVRSRSAFALGEISLRLAELGDLLVDMRSQDLRQPVGLDAEFGGQQRPHPGRPVQPRITLCPELLKKDCFGGRQLHQRPGFLFVFELPQQREIVLFLLQRAGVVEKLDFITSLGHGTGAGSREKLGVRTKGPSRVMTDLCVLEPDAETRELTVVSLHPSVTVEQVEAQCAWKVRFASKLTETPAPTAAELEVLRDLQARTARAHGGDA